MTTPMFQQYHELKSAHPDAILFFRMGDFYEVFFEDAKLAAKVLDITLTSRNRNDPEPIPMAGVPHHAATAYVQKLTAEGHRVAIAEQVEDPAEAKGLVRREVVKVVTPGIALDASYLDSSVGVFVLSICAERRGRYGLAFFDVSTGDLKVTEVTSIPEILAEISRMQPIEAILSPKAKEIHLVLQALNGSKITISGIEDEAWQRSEAKRELAFTLRVSDTTSLGLSEMPEGLRAAGAVVRYGRVRSGGTLTNLHEVRPYYTHSFMVLDETTRRNLELSKTVLGGQKRGSLLWLLDDTATAMGSRLLREWVAFPLLSLSEIASRQEAVGTFSSLGEGRAPFVSQLQQVADIERLTGRLSQNLAGPRDVFALCRSLEAVPNALKAIEHCSGLKDWIPKDICEDLHRQLSRQLVSDPPQAATEGGIFQEGVSDELDELITLSVSGIRLLNQLEQEERDATGIGSLKVRKNRMFGYYIEVTRAHLHKVPERYMRKQTLSNAERYITPELKELEDKVLGAEERRKSLEYKLFCDLRERLAEQSERLSTLARNLAALDVLSTFAELSERWDWVTPRLTDEKVIRIKNGRHPVVEALLEQERFVPNDTTLSPDGRQFIILTGPNMSGKSTVMRQVAVITLLAQIGSSVPADQAEIGLCDRIFTRVGAADNLAQGQSTFMVEMAETAAILHHATDRSLVVLDEIGRGTSTYDGLAIAWAVASDIATRVRCRGFFATHYHELCALADSYDHVANQSVAVTEQNGNIVFIRSLRDEGASRSYGIQCAQLAGLPKDVVAHAKELLGRLERGALRNADNQLSLFGSPRTAEQEVSVQEEHPAVSALRDIQPDALSPREALDLLYTLKDTL